MERKARKYKTKAAATAAFVLRLYEESKTEGFAAKLTPTGKRGLEKLSQDLGLSMAELVEQIGRGEFELVRKAS